ncbi:hypothetical protein Tco_1534908 [Tanacetum coccineum]
MSIRGRVCKELVDFVGVLQNIVVSKDFRDRWKWTLFDDGEYEVKELSSLIEEKILQVEGEEQETLWNKSVPKKWVPGLCGMVLCIQVLCLFYQ